MQSDEPLDQIKLVEQYNGDPSKCGFAIARAVMKALRETRMRRSEITLKFGKYLLDGHASKLGQAEIWSVYEQTFVAALDFRDMQYAKHCMAKLNRQFPGSLRVKRLEGMRHEARGEMDMAMSVYNAILEEDATNVMAAKRKIAVLKSQGQTADAVQGLVDFLQIYSMDMDAWQELGSLYLAECQYKKAAFCYEECLLASPMNHLFHMRYAEIMYTIGGAELRTARKYFASSLELNPDNNIRALYGLLMSCYAIALSGKGKISKEKDNADVFEWGRKQLLKNYSKASSTHLELIVKVVESLQE